MLRILPLPKEGSILKAFASPLFSQRWILAWILICFAPEAFTQETPPYQGVFQQDRYLIGLLELEAIQLEIEHQGLVKTIPQQIFSLLRQMESHRISDKEREVMGQEIYQESIKKAYSDYQTLLDKQEQSFFAQSPLSSSSSSFEKQEGEKKLKKLGIETERELSDFQAALVDLEYQTLESLEIPESLPVYFKAWEALDTPTPFLGPVLALGEIPKYRREQKIDLLIGGSIQRSQEGFWLSLFYSSRETEQALFLEGFITLIDLETSLQQLLKPLIRVALGTDYASLTISAGSQTASIYLDDQLVGIQEVFIPYIEPGMKKLFIQDAGYYSHSEYLFLEAGDTISLSRKLPFAYQDPAMLLETSPQGADVYLEGLWMGKTPLFWQVSAHSRSVNIFLDGFESQQYFLQPYQSGVTQLTLRTEELRESFERAQARFFILLGLLGASITTAFFTNHYTNEFSSILQTEGLSPLFRQRMTNAYRWALGTNITAFSLVGAFSIGWLIDLFVNYIPAVRRRTS